MTRVLVSVRDLDEARLALEAGVDLIDLKEPRCGALGRVPIDTASVVVDWIAARSDGRTPTSIALGELHELENPAEAWSGFPPRASYGKLGLAGCARDASFDWRGRWRSFVQTAPAGVSPVAVCYADWKTCAAPPPAEMLAESQRHDCRAVLIDTFDKARGCLFDAWSAPDLAAFCHTVRRAGQILVLAGSLNLPLLPAAARLKPDYVGFRGAACSGPRDGSIDGPRLADVVAAVRNLAGSVREVRSHAVVR